jgi:hypothetical protein
MLYPNFEEADNLATIHNELYQLPEEYSETGEQPTAGELTADPAHYLSLKHKETPLVTKSLLAILPFDGELPKVSEMPLLSWDGENISLTEIGELAVNYSKTFRHEIGGCEISAREKPRVEFAAGDLFCLLDEKVEKEAGAEVEEVQIPSDQVMAK